MNRGERQAAARENAILNRRLERRWFPKVQKPINDLISSLIDILKSGGINAAMQYATKQTAIGIGPVVQDLYLAVGLQHARRQKKLFGKHRGKLPESKAAGNIGFNQVWIDFIKDFLYKFLLEKITFDTSKAVRDKLLDTMQDGIEQGWGIDKIVEALQELPLPRTVAARIVRTEITRAANTGAMAAGVTFEYEQQKEWISSEDNRVRGTHPKDHASHSGLDGTVIDYDDLFTDPRNGDKLRFPGDPGGNGIPATKAESTINCRCSIAIFAKLDSKGRMIRKRQTTAVIFPRIDNRTIITV